jgi:hypothetical protein
MTEIKTHRDHPSSMEERISKRLRNSGDPTADVVTKNGDGPTRVFHNISHSGPAKKHSEVDRGDLGIDGRKRDTV